MDLKNKRVIITGGTSGIGKATANVLADAGASVFICGRGEARLEKAVNGTSIKGIAADISTSEGVTTLFNAAMEAMGGADVIINNAGIGEFERLEEATREGFERVFATNVIGMALITQAFIGGMKEQGHGTIINIGSTASQKGFALGSMYSASKFAVRGMTQCWQEELRRYNIRVCLVNPSEVTTAFADPTRTERPENANKLRTTEISHVIKSILEMDDRGFVPEVTVWATNPF